LNISPENTNFISMDDQRVKRVGYKLYWVINMELQDLIDVEKKQVEIKAFLVHKRVDYCATSDYQKPKYTDLFKEYDRYKFNLNLNQLHVFT
jgi:hypothetical protein